MTSLLKKSWPKDLPETLKYRIEQPLHAYLLANAKDYPDETAYIFTAMS